MDRTIVNAVKRWQRETGERKTTAEHALWGRLQKLGKGFALPDGRYTETFEIAASEWKRAVSK